MGLRIYQSVVADNERMTNLLLEKEEQLAARDLVIEKMR